MRVTPDTDEAINKWTRNGWIQTVANAMAIMENQRDDARDIAERVIEQSNALQGEVLALRKANNDAEMEVARLTKMIDEMVWPDDGGPASEKSLLDWFAGMALQGIVSRTEAFSSNGVIEQHRRIARGSYNWAKAMISARNGKGGA